ncbi:hypothetical protein HRG_012983 [Hirsutella rhossiliensis]
MMRVNRLIAVAASLLWQAKAFHTICLTSPLTTLKAGQSELSTVIKAPAQTRCEASLQFADPSFLPIHYNFTTIECGGQRFATFTVPEEVPNGDAYAIWYAYPSYPSNCL